MNNNLSAKPFLKWAGGKKQLLPELAAYIPDHYNKYIEPFLGGGALYFHLRPRNAVLADSNEELINCYEVVQNNVKDLIRELKKYKNEKSYYYKMRGLDTKKLNEVKRAARLIYLNKTCFNGLYRVNKKNQFNVPFGKRKNPLICDDKVLMDAHEALKGVKLICDSYKNVVKKHAKPSDFIFFDPPYHPVGKYSDFKRYTKDYFCENDQIELRDIFKELADTGVETVLTNSNTKFVRRLYESFNYKAVDTRRNISSKASTRTGQDLIVHSNGHTKRSISGSLNKGNQFLTNFPGTRYMGSKYKVLPFIWDVVKDLKFKSILDAFSGSSCVSYMFKEKGKEVYCNDFMNFTYQFSKSIIENNKTKITKKDLDLLLKKRKTNNFIKRKFKGLYFNDEDNAFLDSVRGNIEEINNKYKKALALSAISRACLKRRARGVFTFVGNRYDDGRRDMRIGLKEHFIENVEAFNNAVFDNGKKNVAFNSNVYDLSINADLVYIDPPYYTPNSDNDYSRRYHFVEGLVKQWEGLEIQEHTKTKKFKRYESPFYSKNTIHQAFEDLFEKFKNSIIVVSYSSNSIPNKSTLIEMLKKHKRKVSVHQIQHLYSFGTHGHKVGDNANKVLEYLFVAQ